MKSGTMLCMSPGSKIIVERTNAKCQPSYGNQ